MTEEPKTDHLAGLENASIPDLEAHFKAVKNLLVKIYYKDKEIEEFENEIRELENEAKSRQDRESDPYQNPILENELQEIRRALIETDKQYEKTDVQVAFHIHLQQRAKDLTVNVKNDNAILGEFVQADYTQLLDHETKTVAEKVRKLRQTLNALNDDIKNLEKEHQSQVDHLSSQKRWEERKKKEKLKDEIAAYRDR